MLNLSLLTSVEGISNSSVIQNDEDLDKALQDFIANILKAIDVEIRHLVNTKYEGIIVTPVDTDSSTEEGVHLLMSRKLGRKLKNIGDMHVLWGNLQEAIVTYTEAIEEASATNDYCWSSGARCGKATAIYLQ